VQRDANLLCTFLVSGLWHGASWNYVLWGLYHGTLLVATRRLGDALKLPEIWPGPLGLAQIALTWVLMMAGWLFFRETNPEFLAHFLNLSPSSSVQGEGAVGLHLFVLAATWGVPLFIDDLWSLARERGVRPVAWLEGQVTGFRLVGVQALSVGAMLALVLVLRSRTSLDFIYFQF
jgi:alginate O-acetyltransferase complex protein AlgI